MIALPSVDLPEPLGPIRAWNSPGRTCRSTPLRICLSPAATWRFSILSSAMGGFRGGERGGRRVERELRAPRLEFDELGERRALERADDADLHARPQELRGARLAVGVVRAEDASLAVV